jgi:hypothetical protein
MVFVETMIFTHAVNNSPAFHKSTTDSYLYDSRSRLMQSTHPYHIKTFFNVFLPYAKFFQMISFLRFFSAIIFTRFSYSLVPQYYINFVHLDLVTLL